MTTNKKHEERQAKINQLINKKLTIGEQIILVLLLSVSKLTGKLSEFYSISTSMWENHRCKARAKCENSVCYKCYVQKSSYRLNLVLMLKDNFDILNKFDISKKAWKALTIPSINGNARIESHGDTDSIQCAVNYIRIIKSHLSIHFTAWTKNADHWANAIFKEGKPRNMKLVWSSPNFNEVLLPPEEINGIPFAKYVDHVFTVYTKEKAKELGITINCGLYDKDYNKIDHTCKNCMRCYKGRKRPTKLEVSEYKAQIERLGLEYRGHDYYIFELKK